MKFKKKEHLEEVIALYNTLKSSEKVAESISKKYKILFS